MVAVAPGSRAAIRDALKPSLASDWGPLAGCGAYGCEENEKTLLDAEVAKQGVLFMPLQEALQKHPDLLKKHLFSTTLLDETNYAALHAAYFGQGSFVYVPK